MIVLSEYGIRDVARPVHINRVLSDHGHIAVRTELGRELLDAGASPAFAVADHQVAHVYVNDASRLGAIRSLIESTPGVERVLDGAGKREFGIDHPRSGDLIAIAQPDAWFTYYYWQDDERAPDFARTVEIHRKPGYDPVELFLDPTIRHARADRRMEARPPQTRLPDTPRRHPARRYAGERVPRPPRRRHRRPTRRSASAGRRISSPRQDSPQRTSAV